MGQGAGEAINRHASPPAVTVQERDSAVVRLAGDSGDGLQLAGAQLDADVGAVRRRRLGGARTPGRNPRRPGRWPACPASRSSSAATFTRPATASICSSP